MERMWPMNHKQRVYSPEFLRIHLCVRVFFFNEQNIMNSIHPELDRQTSRDPWDWVSEWNFLPAECLCVQLIDAHFFWNTFREGS
jgi:hypothetical protein